MKNYLKSTLYVLGVLWCMSGNINAMEIENPDENSMNIERKFEKLNIEESHDLIYKLLTLKAEYFGEDLHQEIEKIKPGIYEKITEENIKEFVKNYSEEYRLDYLINPGYETIMPCTLYMDKYNQVDPRTLLIAAAYYPNNCETYLSYYAPYFGLQLAYAYRFYHPEAGSELSTMLGYVGGSEKFPLDTLPLEGFLSEESLPSINTYTYQIFLPVKEVIYNFKRLLSSYSEEERFNFLKNIVIKSKRR